MSNDTRIRLLHFLSHGSIGGQERAQYQLFRAFERDDEFDISVAIGRSEGLYVDLVRELGIPIIDLQIHGGYDVRINPACLRRLRQFHIHHLHDPSPNHVLISMMAGRKIRRVYTRRGGIIDYNKYGLKRSLKYFSSKVLLKTCFDGFSGNTKTAVRFVRSFYGIKQRIHVLYNGIDFNLLQANIDKNYVLDELNLNLQDFKIGTACQLADLKRVDLVIRAFHLCRIKNKKLIIFGRGPARDKLRQLALSLDLMKSISFAGEVSNMPDYMQILDCFVLASGTEESFGNALVEAMYLKIPSIIMSDGGGLREHIIQNETGFIAESEEDLAHKMEYVYINPEVSQNVGNKASVFVADKYSIKNMKAAYKEFYHEVMR